MSWEDGPDVCRKAEAGKRGSATDLGRVGGDRREDVSGLQRRRDKSEPL